MQQHRSAKCRATACLRDEPIDAVEFLAVHPRIRSTRAARESPAVGCGRIACSPRSPFAATVQLRATPRSVMIGTIAATPNSTAFSTSHCCRSPLGSATANVNRSGDSRSTSRRSSTTSSTFALPTASTRASNSQPEPSNKTTVSPILARITCVRWCASGPSMIARFPAIGELTKNRSDMPI
jgi:hypothetical protein